MLLESPWHHSAHAPNAAPLLLGKLQDLLSSLLYEPSQFDFVKSALQRLSSDRSPAFSWRYNLPPVSSDLSKPCFSVLPSVEQGSQALPQERCNSPILRAPCT